MCTGRKRIRSNLHTLFFYLIHLSYWNVSIINMISISFERINICIISTHWFNDKRYTIITIVTISIYSQLFMITLIVISTNIQRVHPYRTSEGNQLQNGLEKEEERKDEVHEC